MKMPSSEHARKLFDWLISVLFFAQKKSFRYVVCGEPIYKLHLVCKSARYIFWEALAEFAQYFIRQCVFTGGKIFYISAHGHRINHRFIICKMTNQNDKQRMHKWSILSNEYLPVHFLIQWINVTEDDTQTFFYRIWLFLARRGQRPTPITGIPSSQFESCTWFLGPGETKSILTSSSYLRFSHSPRII